MLKIAILLPHIKAYGGVRRFLEMGNIFVTKGHEFTIYSLDKNLDFSWYGEFNGNITSNFIDIINNDILITGDVELLPYLSKFPNLRVAFIVTTSDACNGIFKYLNILQDQTVISLFCSSTAKEFYEKMILLDPSRHFLAAGATNIHNFRQITRDEQKNWDLTLMFYSCHDMPRKQSELIFNTIKNLGYPMITFSRKPVQFGIGTSLFKVVNPPNNQLPFLYQKAHIFITFERGAGWCNTGAEAMACGVSLITNGNGSSDYAIHNKTAFIANTPDEIIEGIKRLSDNNYRRKLIKEGLKKIQEFSFENLVDRMIQIFKMKGIY